MPWGPNSTIFLAHMRPKMKLLFQILDATEDSDKDLLEKELLHLLCERYSGTNQMSLSYSFNLFCPCGATKCQLKSSSSWKMWNLPWTQQCKSFAKSLALNVFCSGHFSSHSAVKLAGKVENVEHVIKCGVELATKEDCEAFATIAEHTEQWGPLHIFVEQAIGEEEFWTALRRALEHLKRADIIDLNCSHLHLREAKKEDLKAIWKVADVWDVMATDFGSPKLRFNKVSIGEQ